MRGGAYGAGMGAGMDGNISFYSYRDPNPDNSRNTYRQCAEFLKEFSKTGTELETSWDDVIEFAEELEVLRDGFSECVIRN